MFQESAFCMLCLIVTSVFIVLENTHCRSSVIVGVSPSFMECLRLS